MHGNFGELFSAFLTRDKRKYNRVELQQSLSLLYAIINNCYSRYIPFICFYFVKSCYTRKDTKGGVQMDFQISFSVTFHYYSLVFFVVFTAVGLQFMRTF